jgi:hypothetical protein
MTDAPSLIVGRVYFQATYKDPTLSKPIVISFEYLGKDIHGAPVDPADSGHYFQFLPPFEPGDAASQWPDDAPYIVSDSDLSSMRDLPELIEELKSREVVWLASGQR